MPIISQDCQACPLREKCWNMSKSPSDDVLVINLLVCRLKLGIKRESSARLLLKMLQPKVTSLANFINKRCDVDDFQTLQLEIQSAVIEYLLSEYKLGERAWPLHYLFARPRGVITGWAMKYIERKHSDARMMSMAVTPDVEFEASLAEYNAAVTQGQITSGPHIEPADEPEPPATDVPVEDALKFVDDGMTLSAREYRVLRFCLSHAGDTLPGENGTPVSGLHVHLAQRMNWDRSKVSRVFRQASAKVVEVAGHTEKVLGVDVSVDPVQRRNRMLGLGREALTESEGRALVALANEVGDTAACRAFGVHSKTVYVLRKRYNNAEEIDACSADRTDDERDGVPA